MPNTYFQFKQFIVHQEKAAMKVTTDACLFGAWMASVMKEVPPKSILDIGTGTGLLLLMLAQQLNAELTGVELDEGAFDDASRNIRASSWASRIQLVEGDVRSFSPGKHYEWIISNPPFYESSLAADTINKNRARHDAGLTLDSLIDVASELLTESGRLGLMIPPFRVDELLMLANKKGWSLISRMDVAHREGKPSIRSFLILGESKALPVLTNMNIRNDDGDYSMSFRELLDAYYLNF